MNKKLTVFLISILILFFITEVNAQSGWLALNSTTPNNLNCIFFINENIGFAVGASGTFLRTSDGGSNWNNVSTGFSQDFNSVYFFDSNNGLICGSGGLIIATTDNGDTWNSVASNVSDDLYKLSFFNSNGIVGGNSQDILNSTDSGSNWNVAQSGFFGGGFYSSFMLSSNIGFIAGENSIFQPLFGKTTDGGANWNFTAFYLNSNEGKLTGVYFVNENNGFATSAVFDGEGGISKTTDSGSNWNTILYSQILSDITFTNSSEGYAVGYNGQIYKTSDSGNSWNSQSSGTTVNLNSVNFPSQLVGYIAGDNGTILKTISGGDVPVELTSFNAELKNSKVDLNWRTATETNNKGFEIERRSGKKWNSIGFIDGNGTTTEPQNYTFVDDIDGTELNGKIYYKLKQIDFDGSFQYSQEVKINYINIPDGYALNQNYPNPFNPTTSITYALPVESNVIIEVYNSIGKKVQELVNAVKQAGYHQIIFNGTDLSSGVYFYSLYAQSLDGSKDFRSMKKLILIK